MDSAMKAVSEAVLYTNQLLNRCYYINIQITMGEPDHQINRYPFFTAWHTILPLLDKT